jgi:chromosome partitioning protein
MGLFSKKEETNELGCQVISVLNQKGGVGKTTLAFNVAHALAERGKKVLCIDMDPQANLSLLGGIDEAEKHIFHLLINSVRELKAIHSPLQLSEVIVSSGGIDFIPSGQDLSGFELTVAGITAPRQLVFKKLIKNMGLDQLYDVVLVDGPPTLGLITVNILCASTGVLVPFQPDQFSHKGLVHFHDVLEEVADMGIGKAPKVIGYIPNLVESRRKQSEQDFDQILSQFRKDDIPFFGSIPNRVQLVKSCAKRKSVFDFSSKEYKELQNSFLEMADRITEVNYDS